MPRAPYVVGQWVRGDSFYGRHQLIDEILYGNRNSLWLLGTRRIGKTSILKQLEHLTASSPDIGYFPIFWDFQGAETPEDLHESFDESLLDAYDRLEYLGIDPDEIEADDLFRSLSHLRRKLREHDLTLLLLGDEVEELITVHREAPRFLRRLRRALQSAESIRSVLASKIKLWDLAYEETSTSPFLAGFTPPLFVYGLADDEARSLICQSQLPEGSRPQLGRRTIEEIRTRCNNHPYLLQLLCERYLELGDLGQAIEEIATDQMVSHFIAVDFEMLHESERNIIRIVGEQNEATSASIQDQLAVPIADLRDSLQRLEHLGFIARTPGGGYALANYFLMRWFSDLSSGQRVHRRGDDQLTLRDSAEETCSPDGRSRIIDSRYQLLECLGTGATGQVYRANDTLLRIDVAIKILKQERCADAEALERLRREVILARDIPHPNILKVYHLGDEQGLMYMTMQYVAGPDLAQVMSGEGPLPLVRAVLIMRKLTSALQAAHRCEVLHRDIKPSNILMTHDDEPLLTDFGLARLVSGPGITRDGVFLGTPAYASPEQVLGVDLDARSDLYALGVVLFEMVSGRRPFVGDLVNQVLLMHVNEPPPSPQELRPELPTPLSSLILKCLAKEPAQRFQSAAELLTALNALPY